MNMHTLVLSTGSNLGDRRENLASAIELIRGRLGRILKSSDIYESPSWGYQSKNRYYNQCLVVETDIEAEECIRRILEIEHLMGRERTGSEYADRVIDIDILYYNNLVMDSGVLKIPHDKLAERKFILLPLAEILPEFEHPELHVSSLEMLRQCADKQDVKRLYLR